MQTIEDELRRLPGVQQLAWSYGVQPGGGLTSPGDWISDLPGVQRATSRLTALVSPQFLALRDSDLRGRRSPPVDTYTDVIVSERVAKMLWPDDPLGHTFRLEKTSFQVIGVARETHLPAIDARLDRPAFYHPYTPASTTMVSVRCDPTCPEAPSFGSARLNAPGRQTADGEARRRRLRETARAPRASAALGATFAAVAVLAAAGGLFSVLSSPSAGAGASSASAPRSAHHLARLAVSSCATAPSSLGSDCCLVRPSPPGSPARSRRSNTGSRLVIR